MLPKAENAPVLLFCFNRPSHTERVLAALSENEQATQSDLYVFCDGPKNADDVNLVARVHDVVERPTAFKSVKIQKQKTNKGLANSIIDGVTAMIELHGRVIVVEDDLVTSPFFLRFMNDALETYESEQQVISIHGYMLPVKERLAESFFLRGADCWGWATWRRGWTMFEADGRLLLQELYKRGLQRKFDLDGAYPYVRMLKAQIAGKNDSWAIRWHASAFLKNKLTLYPGRSLVLNIGNDSTGTHSSTTADFSGDIADSPIEVTRIPIHENELARDAVVDFYRTTRRPVARIMRRLANLANTTKLTARR
jgi:hypothetical protein